MRVSLQQGHYRGGITLKSIPVSIVLILAISFQLSVRAELLPDSPDKLSDLNTTFVAAPPPLAIDASSLSRFSSDAVAIGEIPNIHAGHSASQAPAGVMGEHSHHAGEFMFSYRYMSMEMDDTYNGDSKVSERAQLIPNGGAYLVIPTEMTMEMHMFGMMYAPNDDVTLMVMVPYLSLEMDHLTAMGGVFTTKSSGFGDVKVTGMFQVKQEEHQSVLFNLGVSIPTGSIDERDQTPMGRAQLPYPMQLGSGTFDLLPSLVVVNQHGNSSCGMQLGGVVRLADNSHGYRLGDRVNATAWYARNLSDSFSASVRLNYEWWDDVKGADSRLAGPPFIVPTADPERRNGSRLDALVGFNIYFHDGILEGHRLAIEAGVPIYQHLDGPQLGNDWIVIIGWQKTTGHHAH